MPDTIDGIEVVAGDLGDLAEILGQHGMGRLAEILSFVMDRLDRDYPDRNTPEYDAVLRGIIYAQDDSDLYDDLEAYSTYYGWRFQADLVEQMMTQLEENCPKRLRDPFSGAPNVRDMIPATNRGDTEGRNLRVAVEMVDAFGPDDSIERALGLEQAMELVDSVLEFNEEWSAFFQEAATAAHSSPRSLSPVVRRKMRAATLEDGAKACFLLHHTITPTLNPVDKVLELYREGKLSTRDLPKGILRKLHTLASMIDRAK